MSLISQFYRQIRTYIYNPVYKGPFEYKKKDAMISKYPFISKAILESRVEEIKQIRSKEIIEEEISPFHLVWRSKSFSGNYWNEKLILRRLGIHQKITKIPAIIPNTPHYNKMLWEVKHLIRIKPLKFPDGIPTEKDIGNIKVDLETGEMFINSKYNIDEEQLEKSTPPPIFSGKYLREYLKWSSGVMGRSLPHHEVRKIDGNHIEEFSHDMKNYYKHQHPFYKQKTNKN